MGFGSHAAELFAALRALARTALSLGAAAGVALALAGVVALTVGAGRRRPLAIVGGAALGAWAALALRGFLAAHLGLSPVVAGAALALLGAAAGAAVPGAFPFAAGALPGALVGAEVPLAGRAVVGAAAGALLLGLAGLALGRVVSAAFASLCGGALLAAGVVAAFGKAPFARELAERPAALAGAALVLAVAGAAFQLARSREAPGARSPESPP